MIIKIITIANIVVSFCVWAPSWKKILMTKSAKDYSLLSFLIIEWLQVSNLGVALAEHAWSLSVYLAVNAVIVAFTMWLVWKYQNAKPLP